MTTNTLVYIFFYNSYHNKDHTQHILVEQDLAITIRVQHEFSEHTKTGKMIRQAILVETNF
jgi:hypothetical protein